MAFQKSDFFTENVLVDIYSPSFPSVDTEKVFLEWTLVWVCTPTPSEEYRIGPEGVQYAILSREMSSADSQFVPP